MENKTTVFDGKKYIIANDFINAANKGIDALIALYNTEKFTLQRLQKNGINLLDAHDINGKSVQAVAVDDIMRLICTMLTKKATTYMTINRNKNIAAVMNRALCELDPEAENLFRKTDETPKEFFNDTDEYATSGFHNKPVDKKPAQKPKPKKSRRISFKSFANRIETYRRKKETAQNIIHKSEEIIKQAEARKKEAERTYQRFTKKNIEAEEEALRHLNELLEVDKKALLNEAA